MAIYSVWGPPQSGKTTLSIDLAYALSQRDLSVCLISPEPYSELSARMKINITEDKSLMSAINTRESLKQTVYKVDDLLYVLAVSCYSDAFSEEINSEDAKKLLLQARILFDVVLVDCPSHAGNIFSARAINMAENVLFINGSQTASYVWHKAYSRAIETFSERFIPICVETRENFNYSALNKLLPSKPEIWLPYIKDADTELITKGTLFKTPGRAGKRYTASLEQLCSIIEENRST